MSGIADGDRDALARDPTSIGTWTNLGNALTRLNNLKAAHPLRGRHEPHGFCGKNRCFLPKQVSAHSGPSEAADALAVPAHHDSAG
jgi:hypothetical protein